MGLTKCKFRQLLELTTEINSDLKYGADDVKGMTITKQIIPTKADVKDTELHKFLVVHPQEFIFNPRTHGKKIGFGYNNTEETFIISWNNIAFRISKHAEKLVLPEYLFLHFNRSEWDREACFRSWGSSTEVFSWDALCEMEVLLPSIEIQQKYVDVYKAMIANQQSYERGLEDLKNSCTMIIENIRSKYPNHRIGQYILPYNEKNADEKIILEQGININKEFITPQRSNSNLSGRKIVRHGMFAYCTQLNNENVAIAYRNGEDCVVSSVYDVFSIINENELVPEYLMLWLIRPEFGRFVYWAAVGSAYEFLNYENLANYIIPIPPINIQKLIGNLYLSYCKRKELNETLKAQIKDICSILIKGSLEEGAKNNG